MTSVLEASEQENFGRRESRVTFVLQDKQVCNLEEVRETGGFKSDFCAIV